MSRTRRIVRTFVPLAIACAIPISIFWIMGPLIGNSASFKRELAMTNPLLDAPPRGYGTAEPVLVGLEASLQTLHSFDFPNQRDTRDDELAWGETVRNNLAWADGKKYKVFRIALGDATASFTSEPGEWMWLADSLKAERDFALYCRTPAFAAVGPVNDALAMLPWNGVVTGEYSADELATIAETCNARDITMYSGFSSFFGPNNEFMAGQSRNGAGDLWLDARAVTGEAPGAVRNLLFLLALQFRPDAVFTHMSEDEHEYAWTMNTVTQDVRNWYTYLRGTAGERPIANIVFDAPYLAVDSAIMHYQRHFVGTLFSSLGLAGYDIEVTKGTPNPDAAIHVIVSEDGGLSESAQALANRDGAVLWLPVRGLGTNGDQGAYLEAFGLNPDELDTPATPTAAPERIDADGHSVRWQTENRQDRFPSYAELPKRSITGNVLAEGPEGAVVVGKGNKAMLNGVALHPEAAFALARTIASLTGREPALEVPFNGYGVAGTRSAFFATNAANLRVRLQHNDGTPFEDGTPIRVIRFNNYGNLKEQSRSKYEAPFASAMMAHEFIVVEAEPQ